MTTPETEAVCKASLPASRRAIAYGDPEPSRQATLDMSYSVMPGLVPGIHVVLSVPDGVDGRDKPGHDDAERAEHITSIIICDSPAASRFARPVMRSLHPSFRGTPAGREPGIHSHRPACGARWVASLSDSWPLVVMDSGLIRVASKWLRHFARECPGMTERVALAADKSLVRLRTRAWARLRSKQKCPAFAGHSRDLMTRDALTTSSPPSSSALRRPGPPCGPGSPRHRNSAGSRRAAASERCAGRRRPGPT